MKSTSNITEKYPHLIVQPPSIGKSAGVNIPYVFKCKQCSSLIHGLTGGIL